MRWSWLVLALLAGRAAAGPCGVDDRVFPLPGATDVPTNTHVWVADDAGGPLELTTGGSPVAISAKPFAGSRWFEIDPGPLLPYHVYTLTAPSGVVTSFTTRRDAEPAPFGAAVEHLRITSGFLDMPVVARDAVMVRVAIRRDKPDGEKVAEQWIPRTGLPGVDLETCTGVAVQPGETLCFWVSALSATGVESGVTGRCATNKPRRKPVAAPSVPVQAPPSTWLHGLTIVICAAVLALLFVRWRAARERLWFRVRTHEPADAVALAWIARRQRIRRLIPLAVILGASAWLLWLAGAVVIVAADIVRLALVEHELAAGHTVTWDEARGRAYVANDGQLVGWLAVRPRDVARAAAANLPTARVTSR